MMSFAYVTLNLVDMWREPKFNSERLNQLFFGAVVSLGKSENGYVTVTQLDGYTGWINERFLQKVSDTEAANYLQSINAVVSAKQVAVTDPRGKNAVSPFFLYYGTRLRIKNWKTTTLKAMLPDGMTVTLKKSGIKPVTPTPKLSVINVISDAHTFLGVGYLWGGVSPAGFDCSGFVQTLFGRYGMQLPRDTKDQITVGSSVPRTGIKKGDLLFFDRHVGIAMGDEQMIHASVGGGGVQVSSLSAGTPNYRADLDRSFREGRRILS